MNNITSDQHWILISEIKFNDGGESEFFLIHKGTENECKVLMNTLPAISYSGARPVISGTLHIVPNCTE